MRPATFGSTMAPMGRSGIVVCATGKTVAASRPARATTGIEHICLTVRPSKRVTRFFSYAMPRTMSPTTAEPAINHNSDTFQRHRIANVVTAIAAVQRSTIARVAST